MIKKYSISFFLVILSFIVFSFVIESKPLSSSPEEERLLPGIDIKSDKSTFLYCSKATLVTGDLAIQPGENMTWRGNAKLEWEVNVSSDEKYELYLIANVRKDGAGKNLSFSANGKSENFRLNSTSGPYSGGKNFQRILLSSQVSLEKGTQKVSLSTSDISTNDILIDIRSIELLPISAKSSIEAENARAIASRASTEWLTKAGYGLMFHWTSQSVQPDGSIKKYEEAVNDFDVEKFANMVDETGAGYVIFTIGHAESYCPAPIKSWEMVHPGHITQRDLIEEIANALNKRQIRLICYINGPLGFNLKVKNLPLPEEKQAFVANFKNILTEMGNRYKRKIAGYWFDSWYQIFEVFPKVPFEEFSKAAKIGNKDRIICLNSWIYPAVTPWQDYWAGEVASPIEIPENGHMKGGPVPDLPYQALLIMEPYWVQQKAEMPVPRFNSEKLGKYIVDCMNNGGAVTINIGIYQDGTVGKKALQILREVKAMIRK